MMTDEYVQLTVYLWSVGDCMKFEGNSFLGADVALVCPKKTQEEFSIDYWHVYVGF
jgi:hypothetical protein